MEHSFWMELFLAVREPLYALIAGVVALIGGMIYRRIAQWVNKDIARLAQTMFQEAAMRAAGLALNILGEKAILEEIKPNDPAVRKALDYMHSTMPDTLAELKVTDQQLANVILANIGKLTAPALGVPILKEGAVVT